MNGGGGGAVREAEASAGAAALPRACDGVDVVELADDGRSQVALAAAPAGTARAGAIVLVPRDLTSRAPAEADALAAVAEVRPYEGLAPAVRSQLESVAQATLFPALRAYQAAHGQRVVGSFVAIDTFVLVLEPGGAVDAMIEGADAAAAADCARERASAVARLADLRRQHAERLKQLEEGRGKDRSPCADNPLAPGC